MLGSAIAAAKLNIRVGHVEAGLRSFDRTMPEEVNRIVADHVSDYLFAPTETARANLLTEGIEDHKICVTGNTIVDAVRQNLEIARKKGDIRKDPGLSPKGYILVTAHRQENVDDRGRLKGILSGIAEVSNRLGLPVVFPVHPRTEKMISSFGFPQNGIRMIQPVGYLDFLNLVTGAKIVLTDSGGVQEEACILRVPCVTLRDNTERPETLDAGANVLAGADPKQIVESAMTMADINPVWENPFGDGTAGKMIVQLCQGMRHAVRAEQAGINAAD